MIEAVAFGQINASSRTEILALWTAKLPKVPVPNLTQGNLRRALVYELQIKHAGGISKKSERTLNSYLQSEGTGSDAKVHIGPGATLIREWNGRRYVVDVLTDGFRLDGRTYKSLKAAAEACGMDRQTLRDWVHRYNEEGVAGLSDRPRGASSPLLDAGQMAQLAAWIEAGPDPERDGVVRWRQRDLAAKIKAEFDVDVHERTVSDYLARLGYVRLTVRPEHPKTSPEAQEAFKKTSPKL